ncbi:Retrotransposable element Tf2 protein [Rhizoctonia solani]|uniref:Retrotransposable element Tf2 protein n=1 Tax=Rhizoctonia solani TaxID=456999 RepID=A0A8H8NZR3_9AGAM|nr:Retrotransposable element Tf2 protein [Rhizoctonia solani]QRW22909.1 Retrotransposable element Tf2 protein [Rhizoctonia solani]
MAGPTKVKEVQSFLGFANFLHGFVTNFSHIAQPLHNLRRTCHGMEEREQEAFQGLKDAITMPQYFVMPIPPNNISWKPMCQVQPLAQYLANNRRMAVSTPWGFCQNHLRVPNKNYNTHDKELLTIIQSFEHWHIFLEGTLYPIMVFTDHRNLEY